MNLTEQLLSRREIYHGRIIDVQVDTVSLPNGNTSTREVVRHPGGVGILALDDEDCAVLVEQYRYVFGRTLLEIPAGKREPGDHIRDHALLGGRLNDSLFPFNARIRTVRCDPLVKRVCTPCHIKVLLRRKVKDFCCFCSAHPAVIDDLSLLVQYQASTIGNNTTPQAVFPHNGFDARRTARRDNNEWDLLFLQELQGPKRPWRDLLTRIKQRSIYITKYDFKVVHDRSFLRKHY